MTAMLGQENSRDSSRNPNGLSLSEAIRAGRLDEFIAQEEARGVVPGDRADLDRALELLIKRPQSAGQTSRSPSRDGSTGK